MSIPVKIATVIFNKYDGYQVIPFARSGLTVCVTPLREADWRVGEGGFCLRAGKLEASLS